MPKRRYLALTVAQRAELDQVRRTDPKPYLRERATALLRIADGESAHAVARSGVLQPRAPDVLYRWLDRYEVEGIAGLHIRRGRGRKPAFFPLSIRQRPRPRPPPCRSYGVAPSSLGMHAAAGRWHCCGKCATGCR